MGKSKINSTSIMKGTTMTTRMMIMPPTVMMMKI